MNNRWKNRATPEGFVPVNPGATIGHVVDVSGCWIWVGALSQGGYGVISPPHRSPAGTAHAFYFERQYGPVPAGKELDHRCRRRNCVNPNHLEAVTRKTNVRRGALPKLTLEKAETIRTRYAAGGIRLIDLANEYGVSLTAVYKLVHYQTWNDK